MRQKKITLNVPSLILIWDLQVTSLQGKEDTGSVYLNSIVSLRLFCIAQLQQLA